MKLQNFSLNVFRCTLFDRLYFSWKINNRQVMKALFFLYWTSSLGILRSGAISKLENVLFFRLGKKKYPQSLARYFAKKDSFFTLLLEFKAILGQ